MTHTYRRNGKGDRSAGLTLVEMLVALAILGLVIALTSGGIVQSLMVNRLQEEATNTQSKMRRVTEVITQELRSAVLGGITNFPIASTDRSISFALLSGDGGVTVLPRPGESWWNSNNTLVYASDPSVLQDLVGHPAVMINGQGQALIIPEITGVPGTNDRVNHNNCEISIPYDPATRLYSARALTFQYVPDDQVLYQIVLDSSGAQSVPFAFDLADFAIAYEYSSVDDKVVLSAPYQDENGNAQPTYEAADGTTYELSRIRVTLATADEGGSVGRSYVSYVELTGLGDDARPVSSITVCDNEGSGGVGPGPGGGGGGGGDPQDPPDDPGDPGGDDGGGDGGGDDGGGAGGDGGGDDGGNGGGGGGGDDDGGGCKPLWC